MARFLWEGYTFLPQIWHNDFWLLIGAMSGKGSTDRISRRTPPPLRNLQSLMFCCVRIGFLRIFFEPG